MGHHRKRNRGQGRGVNKNYDDNHDRSRESHRGGGGQPNDLTGKFTENGKNSPSVSNPDDVQLLCSKGAAGPRIESWFGQSQEDDGFNPAREFRNKIAEAMKKSQTSTLDQKPGPSHKSQQPDKSRLPEQAEGPIENSIVGTAHVSSRPKGEGPLFDDVYDRFVKQSPKFDSSSLPINKVKDKILSALQKRRSLIIEGFTGCGKTTQVPQFIMDDAASKKQYCKIVVTQPRRIAATSVADRVCKERGQELGSLVGYQVGLDRKFGEDSRIVYMTTGVLLETLINKKNLNEWTHIIIDEVHERDLDMDLLMLVIKKIMIEKADKVTKVILMSATLNAEKFKKYFPQRKVGNKKEGAALIKVCHAALYPVKEYYLNTIPGIPGPVAYSEEFYKKPKIAMDIYDMAVRIIESFDRIERKNERRGAVLVFLPGILEIETMYKTCEQYSQTKRPDEGSDFFHWQLFFLHSTMSKEDQDKVFQPELKDHRKIILATNIAESSITFTDIKYVIDFCLTKTMSLDSTTNYSCLQMEWASKNQCIQRRGRCGRVAPGFCYRMVPEAFFERLVQETLPEMQKSSLESVVLHAKILDMGKPSALLASAIDPPKLRGTQFDPVNMAVTNLREVGALELGNFELRDKSYVFDDGELTYLGRIMSKLPIDIRLGRLIMMGHVFGVLEETIIIAAGLSTKNPFRYYRFKWERLDAYISKLSWAQSSSSDCIAFVHLYREWINSEYRDSSDEQSWANKNKIELNVMKDIRNLVEEIKHRLLYMMKIKVPEGLYLTADRELFLQIAIAGGFYPNYCLSFKPKTEDFVREMNKDLICRNSFTNVVFRKFPHEQPGMLYARHILEPFEDVNDHDCTVPFLETDGSKLLLSFDSRGQKVGPICQGVYRAVKMRLLGHRISFRAFKNTDDALKQLEGQKKQLSRKRIQKAPEQTSLPGIQEQNVLVHMRYLVSPGEFYVIKKQDIPALKRLEEELRNVKGRSLTLQDCEVGALVVVQINGSFCRGRIDLLRNNKIVLHLMDFGAFVVRNIYEDIINPVTSHKDQMAIYTTKALAIQCRLKECKPVATTGGNWRSNETNVVDDFVRWCNNELNFQIFSVVGGVISGDLLDRQKFVSLSNILRSKSLVDYTEETMASKEDYKERNVAKNTLLENNDEVQSPPRSSLIQEGIKVPHPHFKPPDFNDDDDTFVEVQLSGPNSPLEMSFKRLPKLVSDSNTIDSKRKVFVDPLSVNSVALNCEYTQSRVLVAAEFRPTRGSEVLVRDTTIMPAIPDMAGLLAMLFCPKMELRVSNDLSRYTGVLTGLGMHPATRKIPNGSHDMEIVFQTVINNEDIETINQIRNFMNLILVPPRESELEYVKDVQLRCGELILNLLTKDRVAKDKEWLDQETMYKWDQLPQEADVIVAKDPKKRHGVFPLHGAVKLI